MSNSDYWENENYYKYYAVEVLLLEPPNDEVEKYLCVPFHWIRIRNSSDKSISFKYPLEDISVTMQRVKRKEGFSNDWHMFTGRIKYASNSYKDLNNFIELLKTGDAAADANEIYCPELRKQLTFRKKLVRIEETESKRLKLTHADAARASSVCQESTTTETVSTISKNVDTQETQNKTVKTNPKKYQYCVVEFSNITKEIGKFMCIPSSWIQYFDKRTQTIVFNYRGDSLEEMEELVRNKKPPLQVGRKLVASLKYSTDSYEDAKMYIITLNDNNSSGPAEPNSNPTPTNYLQMSTSLLNNNEESALENSLLETVRNRYNEVDKTGLIDKEGSVKDIKEIIKDTPMALMTEVLNREKDLDALCGPNFLESLENKYSNLEHYYLMAQKLSDGYHQRCSTLKSIINSIKKYNKMNNEPIDLTPDDIVHKQSQSTVDDQKIKSETNYVKHQNTEKGMNTAKHNKNNMEIVINESGRDFIDLTENDTKTTGTQSVNLTEIIKVETDFANGLNDKRKIDATKQNNNDCSVIILDDDDDDVDDEMQTHSEAQQDNYVNTIPVVIADSHKNQTGNILKEIQHSSKFTSSPNYDNYNFTSTLRHKNKTNNVTELIEGSGVYVNTNKLATSLNRSDNRKSLASKLVMLIFSDVALLKCSLTGYKTKRPPLDEYARNIMFEFVELYGNHKNWLEVNRKDMKNCISNVLYRLRKKKSFYD